MQGGNGEGSTNNEEGNAERNTNNLLDGAEGRARLLRSRGFLSMEGKCGRAGTANNSIGKGNGPYPYPGQVPATPAPIRMMSRFPAGFTCWCCPPIALQQETQLFNNWRDHCTATAGLVLRPL